MEACEKIIVAAIHGTALGGGFETAMACHYRCALPSAKVGLPEVLLGLLAGATGTQRLPRLIGASRAMDLILTGRPVEAEEALAIGLANRVVPVGRARSEAEALAAQLALLPQTCLREDRLSLLEQDGMDEEAAITNEFRHGAISIAADALDGAQRFASGAGRHGSPAP